MYACKDKPAIESSKDPAVVAETMDNSKENIFAKDLDEARQHLHELASTSNHYCIVESEHPYRSATISSFRYVSCLLHFRPYLLTRFFTSSRVEFPPSVQWFTVEFDPQCGTAQLEDNLFISIPQRNPNATDAPSAEPSHIVSNAKFSVIKNATISTSVLAAQPSASSAAARATDLNNQVIVKTLNLSTQWPQSALILPGHRVDFTLETASHYSRDKYANKYGFRCLVVGYENPAAHQYANSCLSRLESELAYLGGMCSANLMKKDLVLPGIPP